MYSNIVSSCRETELKTVLFSYFYDAKLKVKQCERKHVANFLLSRTAGIRLVRHWKLLHRKVGNSPFLLMNLYLILHYYSYTATTLSCHFHNIKVESNDDSHFGSLDALGPRRRILIKNVHPLVDSRNGKKI